MNHYFLFLDSDSWLHRLDPRTKVLGLLGVFVVALAFSDPRYLLLPTSLVLVLIASARVMENLRKVWILLVLLFLYCVFLWPLFVIGRTPLVTVAGQVVTTEGVEFGLGMGVRLDLMLLGGILLLSTTTIEEFTLALERLGLPASMGFALSLAFRWVPSLIRSATVIVQAQRARGLDLQGGHLLARLRRYPPLLVPLIGHQFRQTKLLAMALESKGFGPGAHRVGLLELRMQPKDVLILMLTAILVGFCVWLRFQGHGVINVQF